LKEDVTEDDKKVMLDLMKKTHTDFIHHVEEHRDKKLVEKAKREELIYNADVFLGRKSVELG